MLGGETEVEPGAELWELDGPYLEFPFDVVQNIFNSNPFHKKSYYCVVLILLSCTSQERAIKNNFFFPFLLTHARQSVN